MRRLQLLVMVGLLLAFGLGLFIYKWQHLGYPLHSETESEVWSVQARLEFPANRGPSIVTLRLPGGDERYSLLDESFVSRGYGLSLDTKAGQRSARWAIRRSRGDQVLYYRALLFPDLNGSASSVRPPFPTPQVLQEPFQTAANAVTDDVWSQSGNILTFTSELIERMNDPAPDEYLALLLKRDPSHEGRTRTAQTLLSMRRIPSRLIWVLPLSDNQRQAALVPWLEVHNGRDWLAFNVATGADALPNDSLVWWRGEIPLADVEDGRDVTLSFSTRRDRVSAMMLADERAQERDSSIPDYSLVNLPLQTQSVYSVLLMLPLGALVLLLLRNVVGISTFGTFMPVLVALAFRETHLLWGIALFVLIVGSGLSFRFLLEKLHLLLVPRLTAVLIIVILLMLLFSMLSYRLDIEVGLSLALFPVVIMAMVIERMSIVWEENGAGQALTEGVGTLFTAALAYSVMDYEPLQDLIFTFPELLLVILAIALLFGRYTGYRLTELFRFRKILENQK